jgi:hypothetical protein
MGAIMKKRIGIAIVILLAAATAIAASGVPKIVLKDPDGGSHNLASLLAKGGVLVMTAPTLRDESSQEGWSKYLPEAMPKGGMLIFVEDMSVSDWKDEARKDMKKDWQPGVPPLLLLDETGSVRKALSTERNDTAIYVFNKKGKLVYTDKGDPSAAAAKQIWGKVK